jgi:16S rRNA processing protein RimM
MTASKKIVIGRVAGVFGVKGWVKIRSYTSPIDNFFNYPRCQLRAAQGAATGQIGRAAVVDEGRPHGNGLVAHFVGVDDRDLAAALVGLEVVVGISELPALDDGDFYWHQLEGLNVFVAAEAGQRLLGVIDHLMETGSADVLVIAPTADSIDDRERLIPFQLDVVVKKVDLEAGMVLVDWDPEF